MVATRPDGAFEIRSCGECAVVIAPVQVDAWNAQRFLESLVAACAGHRVVIADMTGTELCDLDAVAALIMALRFTRDDGTDLRVAGSKSVRDQIGTGAARDVLALFGSLSEALQAPRRTSGP